MNVQFELHVLEASRTRLVSILNNNSVELLTRIPDGFNNNPLWHIGHCLVSQQRLMYVRSGLQTNVTEQMMEMFKIGTSPKEWTSIPDLNEMKEKLLSTVELLKTDLEVGIFTTYDPIKTSLGTTLNNHLEAFSFANFHEAMHTGNLQYMLRMK